MIITDNDVVDLSTPTGPMRTSVFRPAAKGRYPGLVLYSEIFQVTAPIRRIAAVLAGHGLVVAVPEIYHELEPPGTVLAYEEADAQRGNQHKTSSPAMTVIRVRCWIISPPAPTARATWASWVCASEDI